MPPLCISVYRTAADISAVCAQLSPQSGDNVVKCGWSRGLLC